MERRRDAANLKCLQKISNLLIIFILLRLLWTENFMNEMKMNWNDNEVKKSLLTEYRTARVRSKKIQSCFHSLIRPTLSLQFFSPSIDLYPVLLQQLDVGRWSPHHWSFPMLGPWEILTPLKHVSNRAIVDGQQWVTNYGLFSSFSSLKWHQCCGATLLLEVNHVGIEKSPTNLCIYTAIWGEGSGNDPTSFQNGRSRLDLSCPASWREFCEKFVVQVA